MQNHLIFQNEPPMFAIKYHENIPTRKTVQLSNSQFTSPADLKPETNKSKQKRPLRSLYHSIDASELLSERYNPKTHLRSEDTEGARKQSLGKKSVSLREKKRINSLADTKKDYQKVPIQFSDETPWSGAKGRVVYKGQTPKNSYYFMSNLQCKLADNQECQEDLTEELSKNSFESDLEFNSRFESGNLQAAVRVSKREYWLYMREDTNTLGLRQWFFFEVTCSRPLTVTFRIYKFTKKYSLYRCGMKPYIKQKEGEWKQGGEKVKYEYDEQMKCFYLRYSYEFVREGQKTLFAGMPPYTYSRLIRYISTLQENPFVEIKMIGRSLGGVDLPLIQILRQGDEMNFGPKVERKAVIIMGRTHPAETCSSYSIETLIQKILQNRQIRQAFDFFIIPMVNPDGVIVGNHRTSLAGVDLNRKFDFSFKLSDKQMFPEVEAVRSLVRMVNQTHRVELLIDLHGHSAKRNIFAYCEKEKIKSDEYLKSRIIPKLLGEYLDSFSYQSCIFQSYKQKKTTARVYFGLKYKFSTITFEQSYGLLDSSAITIRDWRTFGEILISVLIIYSNSFMEKSEAMLQRLKEEIINDENSNLQAISKAENIRDKYLQGPLEIGQKVKQVGSQSAIKSGEIQINKQSILQQQDAQQQQDSSSEHSELESGDEELQNTEVGLMELRNKIFIKQRYVVNSQRQSFALPDTKIQLEQFTRPRAPILHQQKMPLISRIMKMQQRRKTGNLISVLTKNGSSKQRRSGVLHVNQGKLKLPSL